MVSVVPNPKRFLLKERSKWVLLARTKLTDTTKRNLQIDSKEHVQENKTKRGTRPATDMATDEHHESTFQLVTYYSNRLSVRMSQRRSL
jgi:hypothetical protein